MLTIATILFWVTIVTFVTLIITRAASGRRPSPRVMALLAVLNLCSQVYLLINGKIVCTIVYLAAGILLATLAGLAYEKLYSMMRRAIEFIEEHTRFADEDPYELDDEGSDDMYIRANPVGQEETIDIHLSPGVYPIAYKNRIDELMEEEAFDNEEDAEAHVRTNPITLELYYEKGIGLFAVETDAVEAEAACSPYTRRPIICDEDD